MRKLSKLEVNDILCGCVILGTGGGGPIEEGQKIIAEAFELEKDIVMVDLEEIPDEALIVTPYMLGALTFEELDDKYKKLPRTEEEPIILAVNRMEKHIGKNIYGTIACETGGANTAVPMYVAALKDGYVLDADIAGRAVPEVTNSTYYIHGLPAAPVAMANEFGEVAIVENLYDDERSEEVLRSFAIVSNNAIAAVDHAMPFKELKHTLIPKTLTKALALGETYRLAKENNENVAEKVAEEGKGIVAFRGTVTNFEWATKEGFTVGEVHLVSSSGDRLKVWFKNENLMSWLNDEVFVTLPDLICLFDNTTNEPISTPNFENDMDVSVVIYDGPSAFKTDKGLEAFGPRRFGFDMDYSPALGRLF